MLWTGVVQAAAVKLQPVARNPVDHLLPEVYDGTSVPRLRFVGPLMRMRIWQSGVSRVASLLRHRGRVILEELSMRRPVPSILLVGRSATWLIQAGRSNARVWKISRRMKCSVEKRVQIRRRF
jgi:hypothetical protein